MLDDGEITVQFLMCVEIFLFFKVSRLPLGVTHPPTQWVIEALSYGKEEPWHEIHNPPASSTKVNNALSDTSTPPQLHDMVLN